MLAVCLNVHLDYAPDLCLLLQGNAVRGSDSISRWILCLASEVRAAVTVVISVHAAALQSVSYCTGTNSRY